MMRRRNAAASWSMAAAMLCLLAGASLRAGQRAPEASLVSEQYFKNIQVLKGMPVDTFFDAMGMFAASMGNDCTFCHAKEAGFRREAFAETTPRIQRARQMIGMMQALNSAWESCLFAQTATARSCWPIFFPLLPTSGALSNS